jgi:uncharacterized protein DUF4145
MPLDYNLLEGSFIELPEWNCPSCLKGKLIPDLPSFITHELAESQKDHNHPDWEPYWIREKFYGNLVCNNKACKENVTIAGQTRVQEDYRDDYERQYTPFYYPQYFYPPLKLFEFPENLPDDLEDSLENLFKLFWIDNSACANALRTVVEEILTDQRIAKTVTNAKNKRQRLDLHKRIEKFRIKNPDVADYLLATKWIGNTGSHAGELSRDDVIAGLEVLHAALNKLYSDTDKRIHTIVRKINIKKGPI